MLKSLIGGLLFAALLLTAADKDAKDGWKPTPLMRTVTPDEAKAGDTLTISGENLDKAKVAEVYLTTGEDNFKLQIVAQEETKLEVKITTKVKSGRLRLMVLTAGLEPTFLEQPLVVNVQ